MIVAGCDVGSTTGKVILLKDGEIVGDSLIPATAVSTKTGDIAMSIALEKAGLKLSDVEYCIGTGYGRVNISFAQKNVTEISCHGRGAHYVNPKVRTVIDIGGQDCKVVKIDDTGTVKDFVMNDKCAAGTGRFLQDIAQTIGLSVEELGPVSMEAKEILKISSQCSVFAQSEVVSLLKEKRSRADIAAGLNDSVASRLVAMVHRVGLEEDVIISGGVSKNIGVVTLLSKKLGVKMASAGGFDPQLLGALGAAIFAKRALEKKKAKAS